MTFDQVLENRQKWISYLKSGEALKTKSALEIRDTDGKIKRCCLGHACHVLGGKYEIVNNKPDPDIIFEKHSYGGYTGALSWEYVRALGLRGSFGELRNPIDAGDHSHYQLSEVNDGTDLTPQEIGQFIEDNYNEVFLPEEEWIKEWNIDQTI